MPYVGNSPAANFASVTKDAFSGDGSTTAFTLSKAATTNGVAVFVENVRQEPTTAYAVSGTTLTFTAAPVSASGNNIYVLHHNAPASTATHPSGQNLLAVNGTFSGDVSVGDDLTVTDDILLSSDSAAIKFGADSEITLTHSADSGLLLKHANTADDSAAVFTLQTGDTDIASDDVLGSIKFQAPDEGTGTDAILVGASIDAVSEGDFSSSSNATRLEFKTGSSEAPSKRFQIESNGNIGFGKYPATFTSGTGMHMGDDRKIGFGDGGNSRPDFQLGYNSSTDELDIACGFGADTADIRIDTGGRIGIGIGPSGNHMLLINAESTSQQAAVFKATGASYATEIVNTFSTRSGNSAFSMFRCHSNSNNDVEFNFKGDGDALADGSFSGGGADYAEYFEWKDGNTSNEDRVGYSVVLDGHKIRKATSDDSASNIIGVISANPAIIGDGDSEKWKQKYLRTDFGNYDLDENGDRKLNPKWDESKKDEYVSREDRKEWDTVGLMGKLRMLKGQPTGDRWIKMKDISDTVEEWLVR